MARTMAPNSAGSQFFLMTSNSPHLDGQYAGFGKVIEGLEIAMDIEKVKTGFGDKPKADEIMEKVNCRDIWR